MHVSFDEQAQQPLKCYPPHPQFTGRCQWQPHGEDTRSAWYFDANLNFQETGFLDAPMRLPSGSVRAVDIGDLRLMVSEVEREGGVA